MLLASVIAAAGATVAPAGALSPTTVTTPPATVQHLAVVVLENHSLAQIDDAIRGGEMPYLASLTRKLATLGCRLASTPEGYLLTVS